MVKKDTTTKTTLIIIGLVAFVYFGFLSPNAFLLGGAGGSGLTRGDVVTEICDDDNAIECLNAGCPAGSELVRLYGAFGGGDYECIQVPEEVAVEFPIETFEEAYWYMKDQFNGDFYCDNDKFWSIVIFRGNLAQSSAGFYGTDSNAGLGNVPLIEYMCLKPRDEYSNSVGFRFLFDPNNGWIKHRECSTSVLGAACKENTFAANDQNPAYTTYQSFG